MSIASRIPILNLYHLLCYAWDVLDEGERTQVDADELHSSADLLTSILIRGTRYQLRRGLDRTYVEETEELGTLRGKFLPDVTFGRALLERGKVACTYDEFSYNILPNRILKTTLLYLWRTSDVTQELKGQVRELLRRLEGIEPLNMHSRLFKQIAYHRNNQFYRLLMSVCELVFRELKPFDRAGEHHIPDFLREKKKLAHLFEMFLLQFYKKHATDTLGEFASVNSLTGRWPFSSTTDPGLSLVPSMITDVTIDTPTRRIIMDAKFYETTLVPGRNGGQRYHSSHLYQLDAYLRYMEAHGKQMCGILLYPVVDQDFLHEYSSDHGTKYKIGTVDLGKDWREVEERLKEVIKFNL